MKCLFSALVAVSLWATCGTAGAETTVKLTQMHICCGGCTKAIVAATKDLKDSKTVVDQDNEEVTITADSPKAAQTAVDAILAAGYHAKVASGEATIPRSRPKRQGNPNQAHRRAQLLRRLHQGD